MIRVSGRRARLAASYPTLIRWNTPRPSLTAGRTVFTYSGTLTGVPASAGETFDVGEDTRTGVALIEYRYDVPFKFTGKIDKLTFKLEPEQTATAK